MQLFNTLTRQLEEFTPVQNSTVTLYVCGITPYDTTHLGHAFTYLSFDLLVRFLKFQKYRVLYTQNVTDINDRDNDILKRAQEQHTTWEKLSEFWTDKFLKDMAALNWIMPTHYLYASKEIPAMVSLIEDILNNNKGYVVNSGVYLDVTKAEHFGKLSKFSKEEMLKVAADFEEDIKNPDKKHPLDITLWRPTAPNQPIHIPSFDSPWGKGRPGWHIECAAMALNSLAKEPTKSDTLYQSIDIHGGGIDLIFPHHESEIAEAESGTRETPFAKYWMHTGTVFIEGQKMSKSLGNLILVSNLLKKYSPNAIRWVLLSHHYREPWEYQEEEFQRTETLLGAILANTQKAVAQKTDTTDYKALATEILSNDLNAPMLLERLALSAGEKLSLQEAQGIHEVMEMMGFRL